MSLIDKGQHYERQAERYLRDRGLETIARNFRCRSGELDLVMRDGGSVVFVEVRYRRTGNYGSPIETITPRKQQRLIRAAEYFLLAHPDYRDNSCRFDTIGIGGAAMALEIEWIKDAFSA